jgi:hypothetical protein
MAQKLVKLYQGAPGRVTSPFHEGRCPSTVRGTNTSSLFQSRDICDMKCKRRIRFAKTRRCGQIPTLAVRSAQDFFVRTSQSCVATCCSNSTPAVAHRSCASITDDRNLLYSACEGGPSCRTNRATTSEYSRAATANCSANLRRSLQDDMGEYQV